MTSEVSNDVVAAEHGLGREDSLIHQRVDTRVRHIHVVPGHMLGPGYPGCRAAAEGPGPGSPAAGDIQLAERYILQAGHG